MKILNLYAGIGGNRKLWGNEHDITAVELRPEIAAIYQDFFQTTTWLLATRISIYLIIIKSSILFGVRRRVRATQRFELEPVLLEVNQNRFISTRSFGKKLFFLKHTAKKTLSLKMLFLTISR